MMLQLYHIGERITRVGTEDTVYTDLDAAEVQELVEEDEWAGAGKGTHRWDAAQAVGVRVVAGSPAESVDEKAARVSATVASETSTADLVKAMAKALDGDRTDFDAIATRIAELEA